MRTPLSALPALVLLAACGEVSGTINTPGPTASQALELSLAVTDEAESAVAAATVARVGSPPGWTLPAGCPTLTGTADSDGDGIPDNGTFTFTAPPCLAAFRNGSVALTGTLGITDPNFASNAGYTLNYGGLAWAYVDSTGPLDYSAVRNGTRTRLGSSDAVTLTSVLTIVRSRPSRADATVSWDGGSTFTATVPGTLALGQPAPDGTLSLSGTLRWRRSTEDWLVAVATPAPLVYDKDCTATPRLKGGTLTLTGTIAGQSGTLQFTWSQCGIRPVATWIPD